MESENKVIFYTKPSLRKPYIICGLNGSFNAGNVSIAGVNYFVNQFHAIKFAEMPASRYHVYQVPGLDSLRPTFKMQDGLKICSAKEKRMCPRT